MSKVLRERQCKECGKTFQPKTPINSCKECVNLKARRKRLEELGEAAIVGEDGYLKRWGRPNDIEGVEYNDRCRAWKKKASFIEKNFKTRPEWQEYFKSELDRIANDKPLWASLTRDTLGSQTNIAKETAEPKKMGRPSGNTTTTYRYKDTRDMNWDDFDSWGYGLEEDM